MDEHDSAPSDKPPYDVGYRKPPKQHQFKKGQSGNPGGRPRKNGHKKIEITSMLEQPVRVRVGQKTKKMQVFEASVCSLVTQAIKEKKIAAAIEFLTLCDEHNLIVVPDRREKRLVVPKDYDYRKWREMLETYGPPPWPSEHNGLPKSKPRQIPNEQAAPKRLPNPLQKRSPATKREPRDLLYEVAAQQCWTTVDGKRARRSVLELVLMVLRTKVVEGHRRARRFYDQLCKKYGVQEIRYGGLLDIEEITTEEWVEKFGRPKPDSASS
jgi:hypothetical protein